jgi:hypothetical protein
VRTGNLILYLDCIVHKVISLFEVWETETTSENMLEGRGFRSRRAGWIFYNLHNSSNQNIALGFIQFLIKVITRKCFCGVKRGRLVRLTTSPSYVNRLSRPGLANVIHLEGQI